jgi:hypothetical protein
VYFHAMYTVNQSAARKSSRLTPAWRRMLCSVLGRIGL